MKHFHGLGHAGADERIAERGGSVTDSGNYSQRNPKPGNMKTRKGEKEEKDETDERDERRDTKRSKLSNR